MSHNHNHTHSASSNIAVAFFLNIIFAVIELFGGLLTNSVAILSDALHDFGDSLSLGVAWYLQKISQKKGDRRFSYGYKRFSLLGSLFISIVLVVGSAFIIVESVGRFTQPQQPNAPGMILLSILGIAVNGAAVFRLKKGKGHNEKSVKLHMMEDLLGWIAVLIGGVIMHFFNLPFIDPLLSVLIAMWVLFNVFKNLFSTVAIMLQEVPKDIDVDSLANSFNAVTNILSIHDLHVWSLDGENHILSVHLVVEDDLPHNQIGEIKERVREISNSKGISHVTVEIETKKEASECHYLNHPC